MPHPRAARTAGLVAAAGASSRFGACKALLPHEDGTPVVKRLLQRMLQCGLAPLLVTVPDGDDGVRVRDAVADLRVMTLENPRPQWGLGGSVRAGLEYLVRAGMEVDALLLCPVDHPFVDAGLMSAVLRGRTGHAAAVPVYAGRRGHPVVFSSSIFGALLGCGEAGGPRGVLADLGSQVAEVTVTDPAALEDVNTPAAWEHARRRVAGTPSPAQ